MKLIAWIALWAATIAFPLTCYGRIWKDKTGKFQIEAELDSFVDGKVTLKNPTGSWLRFAWNC